MKAIGSFVNRFVHTRGGLSISKAPPTASEFLSQVEAQLRDGKRLGTDQRAKLIRLECPKSEDPQEWREADRARKLSKVDGISKRQLEDLRVMLKIIASNNYYIRHLFTEYTRIDVGAPFEEELRNALKSGSLNDTDAARRLMETALTWEAQWTRRIHIEENLQICISDLSKVASTENQSLQFYESSKGNFGRIQSLVAFAKSEGVSVPGALLDAVSDAQQQYTRLIEALKAKAIFQEGRRHLRGLADQASQSTPKSEGVGPDDLKWLQALVEQASAGLSHRYTVLDKIEKIAQVLQIVGASGGGNKARRLAVGVSALNLLEKKIESLLAEGRSRNLENLLEKVKSAHTLLADLDDPLQRLSDLGKFVIQQARF